jgi:flagellar motility protein MotE (MotC chaperone)
MSLTSAGAEEVPRSTRLREALVLCATLCDPFYARADADALRQQRRHRAIVDIVAVAGTIAILAGIAPIAERVTNAGSKVVETLSAATALLAVGFGLYARSQRRWLLERHRAERLRALQYHALIAVAADESTDLERWRADLNESIAALDRLTAADMKSWLQHEEAASVEHAAITARDSAVVELASLYAGGRLYEQCEYFRRKADRNERADTVTRHLVSWLFFVSVGAIVPASLIRIFRGPEHLALIFVAVAAGAPAIAAGIRLVRSAHEFARNGTRFRAKYLALFALRERLERESNAMKLLNDLHHAELLLAAEHREWLRLMLDAEWYG